MQSRTFIAAPGLALLCLTASMAPAFGAVAPAASPTAASAVAATGPGNEPDGPTAALLATVPTPNLDATSWLVLDVTSGQVLAEHNADAEVAPASLTKLMTAYLSIKAIHDGTIKLDQTVDETNEAWRTGGSRMFIDPKVPISVNDLLLGMIVDSGNDAAVTLAQTVGGSVSVFTSMMNNQAAQWGLKNTHFMDPTGLPTPGHYTSAHDLSVIASHLIRDFPQDYARYFKVKKFTYNGITQPNRVSLLFSDPSVDGMKTGFTNAAGYCMITSAQRTFPSGTRRLITVVMGTPSEHVRGEESAALLNWGFQNFDDVHVATADQTANRAQVWKGLNDHVDLGSVQSLAISVPRADAAEVKTDVVPLGPLLAPIAKGQRAGEFKVSVDNKPVVSYPLVSLSADPAGSFLKRTWDSLRLMIE